MTEVHKTPHRKTNARIPRSNCGHATSSRNQIPRESEGNYKLISLALEITSKNLKPHCRLNDFMRTKIVKRAK